ncbi:hypothetical protein CBP51_03240 [Cellvibrio mixtus]|uniref:TniQ domain-containing protein n=1 Tax=Cellvibrio mixtus TaxID=39650 RepID=A0A266Q8A9_9GAMM|nr:hypothetical protein CBP51_03240 [Cellvibrio mixtus]
MNTRLNNFPLPLPDEHILSTLVRWHAVQYYENFHKSCSGISTNSYNLKPDSIWRRIFNDILNILPDSFGLKDLIKHTLLNYYSVFQTNGFSQTTIVENCSSERKTTPKFQKFIKNTKEWRWCHFCTEEDEEKYGTSYWHCSHQIPTVARCKIHAVDLIGKCRQCNFSIRDLASGLLPSGSHCRQCGALLISVSKIDCSVKQWICQTSEYLHQSNGDSKIVIIKEELKNNLECFLESNRISVARRNHSFKVKNAIFKSILTENSASEFLSPEFHNSYYFRIFNVNSIIFGEEKYPPLYYLLLLKAIIKDDNKINQILGIDLEGSHDQSLSYN